MLNPLGASAACGSGVGIDMANAVGVAGVKLVSGLMGPVFGLSGFIFCLVQLRLDGYFPCSCSRDSGHVQFVFVCYLESVSTGYSRLQCNSGLKISARGFQYFRDGDFVGDVHGLTFLDKG